MGLATQHSRSLSNCGLNCPDEASAQPKSPETNTKTEAMLVSRGLNIFEALPKNVQDAEKPNVSRRVEKAYDIYMEGWSTTRDGVALRQTFV